MEGFALKLQWRKTQKTVRIQEDIHFRGTIVPNRLMPMETEADLIIHTVFSYISA
jgi:hypothetical protein